MVVAGVAPRAQEALVPPGVEVRGQGLPAVGRQGAGADQDAPQDRLGGAHEVEADAVAHAQHAGQEVVVAVPGLDAPGHYTTASDLGVLSRYAMSKPAFRDIVRRSKVTIGTGRHRETLVSTDLLLGTYAGAIGIKTGNTNGAGYSVVSAAERGGVSNWPCLTMKRLSPVHSAT